MKHTLAALALTGVLAACSAGELGEGGTMSVLPPDPALAGEQTKKASNPARCRPLSRWYEGFLGKKQTHKGAEGELNKAIVAERARLTRRGYEGISVRNRASVCKPSYPIGFKEWKCTATASICVSGRAKRSATKS